ncbi:MAG TPA: vWA domain-containing protein, partial [Polyangiaceae bacterium]
MSFSIRRAALTSICLAAVAALAPVACSSKPPAAESILGCTSDSECENGYCESGLCKARCSPTNNICPVGQACNADGRCVTGGTGGTGSGGTSSGGSTGGTGLIIPDDGGRDADDGSLDPDAACGTGSATATLTPVSMFVMFDRSGSMITETTPTRWDNAAAALTSFFQDPEAADLAVALRFFPHDVPAPGCTNSTMSGCVTADCAQPIVPLMADPMVPLPKLTADPGPVDAHEAALVASITSALPGRMQPGGTPTHAALEGALSWATAYQTAHPRPEQQTVVVLVTDGEPNGCGMRCGGQNGDRETCTNGIEMLAANALATSEIRTFVVGLTDEAQSLAFLDELAAAGGTNEAFIVLDGPT